MRHYNGLINRVMNNKKNKMPVFTIPPIPPKKVKERTCRECGCTELHACIHPEHGPCWWVEEDLCSLCKNWPGESIEL
jgi:hypothetical protein